MRFLSILSVVWNVVHRRMSPLSHARKIGVRFGSGCRFICVNFGSEPYLITLGDHVSISHAYFINHDGALWLFRDKAPDADAFGPITIGNNVFIGTLSVILPGVTIGDNVIIGSHSLVNKDIPSGSIVAGVPAKPIGRTDTYWEKVRDRTLSTKRMTETEKREFLMKHFQISLDKEGPSTGEGNA